MTAVTLTMELDTGRLSAQLATLEGLLQQVPKRVARRFYRKALRLFSERDGIRVAPKRAKRGHCAAQAGDRRCIGRFGVDVAGLDELIAAAARRAKHIDGEKSPQTVKGPQ